MGNNSSNYYGLFFQDGDPQGMNESVLQYPGHLGLVADVQCHDGITREMQIVQADSVMGTAPQEGALAYWKNEDQFRVTTDDAVAGFGLGRCVGVFTRVVDLGYYTAIVKKGRKTNVWFVDAPAAAPSGAGLFVIPSATDGRADTVAAGTAASYPPIGRTAGTQDGTTKLGLVDVDVYAASW
jgi:hypothetical protein